MRNHNPLWGVRGSATSVACLRPLDHLEERNVSRAVTLADHLISHRNDRELSAGRVVYNNVQLLVGFNGLAVHGPDVVLRESGHLQNERDVLGNDVNCDLHLFPFL
jgi:hypothetical protein